MKVILSTDIYGLGDEGDVVTVSNGFARNYLLPKKLVHVYNTHNFHVLQSRQTILQKKKKEKRHALLETSERIRTTSLTLIMKTNEKGMLYGSVSKTQIINALKEQNIETQAQQLLMREHSIRSVGRHSIFVRMNSETRIALEIIVKSENHPEQEEKVAELEGAGGDAETTSLQSEQTPGGDELDSKLTAATENSSHTSPAVNQTENEGDS